MADKLSTTFHDFDKDSEACRKKWVHVLGQYRIDKAHNSVSGNDRKYTCKWFDVVDEYYHNRAQVKSVSHASSVSCNATTLETQIDEENEDGEPQSSTAKAQPTPSSTRQEPPKIENSLSEMANTGRALLDHLKESSIRQEATENKCLDVLAALHATMVEFLNASK